MFAFSALLINERTKIMKIENWRSCHQNQREASIAPVFPKILTSQRALQQFLEQLFNKGSKYFRKPWVFKL